MPRESAAIELLNQYAPLVRRIAGGFHRKLPRSVLRDDVVAAGMRGLWDAIQRSQSHGAGANNSFEWYVRVRIRGAILDELRTQDWETRRTRLMKKKHVMLSLDLHKDSYDSDMVSCLTFSTTPEDEAIRNQEAAHKASHLANLMLAINERQRYVIRRYLAGKKFKDIAVELKLSEPRISQIYHRAIALMQARAEYLSIEKATLEMKSPCL